MATSKKKVTKKKKAKKSTGARAAKGKLWSFPKNTLEDALRVARSIEDKNAGNPMRASDLVIAVGYKKPNDWRFQDLLRSANLYGLVSGTGATATVKMEKLGEDVVAPSSSTQRQEALMQAFKAVESFKKVDDFYGGKRIPEDEFFENTLVREFSIPRDRVKIFTEVFTENYRYLNLFAARSIDTEIVPAQKKGIGHADEKITHRKKPQSERVREFLDTCFVMMPFGEWFDRYYQDVYIPAIKEAGFEPVRADELFSTGTVVEQIWEQIQKGTVLLADLSHKNANVFYELGLAHAANKPVVFTTSNIDDIPFDLRHLRVIVYDIREPDWATKLGKSVTDYLKNAKSDPIRSIPQPFREVLSDLE